MVKTFIYINMGIRDAGLHIQFQWIDIKSIVSDERKKNNILEFVCSQFRENRITSIVIKTPFFCWLRHKRLNLQPKRFLKKLERFYACVTETHIFQNE